MTTQTPPLTGQDINLAARAVRDLLDILLDRAGLSFEQSLALQALGPAPGGLNTEALIDDLATRLRVPPSTVRDTLQRLVAAGLIEDETPTVRLTPTGRATYDEVQAGISHVVAEVYGSCAPEDLATTRRVLREITARAESLRPALAAAR
jgi:DNA-binding MarR family transcriptional regulator